MNEYASAFAFSGLADGGGVGTVVGAFPPPARDVCAVASSGEYLTLLSLPFRQLIFTGSVITNLPALTSSLGGTAQPSRPTAMRAGPSLVISPLTVI